MFKSTPSLALSLGAGTITALFAITSLKYTAFTGAHQTLCLVSAQ